MVCKVSSLNELSALEMLFLKQENCFFSSLPWYQNWIKTVLIQDKERAQFLSLNVDGEIKLVLPLKYSPANSGVRIVESLGNYYSPIFNFLGEVNVVNLSLFFKQFKELDLSWDSLILQPMAEEDVLLINEALKSAGLISVPFFCFANWYVELNGRSFEMYFSQLSSRVKNTVTRKMKRFNNLEGTELVLIIDETGLKKAIADFEAVYALSWKEAEPYPDFMKGLMQAAAGEGALRLGIAYLNEQPIAAQFWIVADNTASIYKLAYDEAYKSLSIGSILTVTLMRHVIDVDKVACVDYLSGDDTYKREWMSHRRERWGIKIFNTRTLSGFYSMLKAVTRFYIRKFRDYGYSTASH